MWSAPKVDICDTSMRIIARDQTVRTHKVVAVVVAFLPSHAYLNFVIARVTRGFQEILRKDLALLVEVVSRTLRHGIQDGSVTRPHQNVRSR